MKIRQIVLLLVGLSAALSFLGCSTMSNAPDVKNVKVSREEADKDCQFISKIEGRTNSLKGTNEDALKDLQQEAANKGANFLVVRAYSGTGTSVSGEAYKCP